MAAQAPVAVVVVVSLIVVVGVVVDVGLIVVVGLVAVVGFVVVVPCLLSQLHAGRNRSEQVTLLLAFVGDDPATPQPMRAVSIAMSSYHHVSVLPE